MRLLKTYIKQFCDSFFREFRLAVHDVGLILFLTFLPLIYPVIYSLIYNPELVKDVAMVVVDNDRTPLSRELVRELDACDEVWVTGYAANLGEARHAMDSHKCYAILEIPENFEKKVGNSEVSPAVMYCDMSLLLRYRGFLMASTDVMMNMGSELMTEDINRIAPLADTIAVGDPMAIANVNLGNIEAGFDSFIMPGILILILHQCIILAIGMAGGAKRENPVISGYNHTGTRSFVNTQLLGQTLCYMAILFVPMIYMIHYVPLMFKFPMAGNFWQEVAFLFPMMIACCGMGFCFQAIVMEREAVFVMWVVTSLVFLLLSGLIWPLYDLPGFWKGLSMICPSTWGVEGFIKMSTNGASLMQVWPEYRNLWWTAAGWWIAGYCVQKWYFRPTVMKLYARQVAAGIRHTVSVQEAILDN